MSIWRHYAKRAAAALLNMPDRYHLYSCQFASPLPSILARQMTAKLAVRYTRSPLLQTSFGILYHTTDYKTAAHPRSIFTATLQSDGMLADTARLSACQLAMLALTLLYC